MPKTALITGVTGQDGSYLAELLVENGYDVYGVVRRTTADDWRLNAVRDDITVLRGNLQDQGSLNRAVAEAAPDEIYNLGAQSYVGRSWDEPIQTGDVTGLGVVRMLEAYREHAPDATFIQAGSSEQFGNVDAEVRDEETRFRPRSPYACAKTYGYHAVINYRESYGLDCAAPIMFNHESPRRGEEFLTRKVTKAVAEIEAGHRDELGLGNLDPVRDWGYAPDYVRGLWQLAQEPEPFECVFATGETHSVRKFVDAAFSAVGLDWQEHVYRDDRFYRPADVEHLRGDYSTARDRLGWEPKTDFEELVETMVKADRRRVREAPHQA